MRGQTRLEFIFGVALFSVLIFFIVNHINTIFSTMISDYEVNSVKAEAESLIGLLSNYRGEPDNWNTFLNQGWSRRKKIDISSTSVELIDQQIRINVTWDSDMKSDFGDIRFADSDMVSDIPYWIEKKVDSSYADVWIRIPKIPDYGKKSMYMYYGYAAASSQSSGDRVFMQFLDLNGGSLPNGWVKSDITTSGAATVSNGLLTLKNSNGNDIWNNVYQATHVFKNSTVYGNIVAVAKINGQKNTGSWAKAGITLQDYVTPRNYNGMAMLISTPGNGYTMQWQQSDYYVAPDQSTYNGDSVSFPSYIKLVRNNSIVSGFYSRDGRNWNQVGNDVIPIGIEDFQYPTLIESPTSGSAEGEANFSSFYVYRYAFPEPQAMFRSEEARTNDIWFPVKTIGLLDSNSKSLSNSKISALNASCSLLDNLKIGTYRLTIYNSTSLALFCGSETLKPPRVVVYKNVMIEGNLGNMTLELW
jgi:hypothetical protein